MLVPAPRDCNFLPTFCLYSSWEWSILQTPRRSFDVTEPSRRPESAVFTDFASIFYSDWFSCYSTMLFQRVASRSATGGLVECTKSPGRTATVESAHDHAGCKKVLYCITFLTKCVLKGLCHILRIVIWRRREILDMSSLPCCVRYGCW